MPPVGFQSVAVTEFEFEFDPTTNDFGSIWFNSCVQLRVAASFSTNSKEAKIKCHWGGGGRLVFQTDGACSVNVTWCYSYWSPRHPSQGAHRTCITISIHVLRDSMHHVIKRHKNFLNNLLYLFDNFWVESHCQVIFHLTQDSTGLMWAQHWSKLKTK